MKCAVLRTFMYILSPAQLQLFLPSTIDTYNSWVRKTRARAQRAGNTSLLGQIKEDIEALPDGRSHILWVGNRQKATKIVYFFHGGGYLAPMLPGHLEWCLQAYILGRTGVAVAVLQYTLCPQGKLPTQLCQAAAGLSHLLRSGVRPGNLVIGGDSAGGNLTMQLLSHVLHPHPRAGNITLNEPLAGVFLVSPFVSGRQDFGSFKENRHHDMLSLGIIENTIRELFYDTRPNRPLGYLFPRTASHISETEEFTVGKDWALPADADESWLDGLGTVVQKVYVTVGGQEMFRDQGILISQTIRTRNPGIDMEVEVADKEAHDFILLEGETRVVGDATSRMKAWFSSVLG